VGYWQIRSVSELPDANTLPTELLGHGFVNTGDAMETPSMPMKRRLELETAHLVAAVLDGEPHSRDEPGPGAKDGMHDFDVILATGQVIALEVTTAANQRMIETTAAFRKLRDARYPSLSHHWGLTGRHPSAGERGPQINGLVKQGGRSALSARGRWRLAI
jgi:hypothetical protein